VQPLILQSSVDTTKRDPDLEIVRNVLLRHQAAIFRLPNHLAEKATKEIIIEEEGVIPPLLLLQIAQKVAKEVVHQMTIKEERVNFVLEIEEKISITKNECIIY
jgi:hypothetical protein